mgnify:CR=1 FL=1
MDLHPDKNNTKKLQIIQNVNFSQLNTNVRENVVPKRRGLAEINAPLN